MNIDQFIPVITALVGGIGTYLVTRNSNGKDIVINDRVQLSNDEKQFRQELREELRQAKDEISELRKQILEVTRLNTELLERLKEYEPNQEVVVQTSVMKGGV